MSKSDFTKITGRGLFVGTAPDVRIIETGLGP